jgi:hypothetical protein
MNPQVKTIAQAYADEMGRETTVAHTLDHGTEALAYCYALDDAESFALLLRRTSPWKDGWAVVDEVSEEDYLRNVERDGVGTSAFFEAVEKALRATAGPMLPAEVEAEELEAERGAALGDPRRCSRHGEVTSSPDGMFDGLCGACEAEADGPVSATPDGLVLDPPFCPGCGAAPVSQCQCPPASCEDCGAEGDLVEEDRELCNPETGPRASDLYTSTVCRDRDACANRVADAADDQAEDRAWRGGR